MKTSGKTMVCGVMGCPIEHSMSPMMHNYYSEQMGVDMTYVPFKVQPGQVGAAVRGAYALNVTGVNVTVPHKQAVMEHLCGIDEAAETIGAVNTLVRQENGYKGYNTDAAGLFRAMTEAGMEIRDKTCILLGAGGAAKAAAYVLAKEGAARVYVLNRSVDKARSLAADINGRFGRELLVPLALSDWRSIPEKGCLAVQTTSVGMHPEVEAAPVTEPEFYEKLGAAFDVIYTPVETKFMKLAASAGAKTSNGLDMLLYQGIAAYELWYPEVRIPEPVIDGARELLVRFLGGDA